MRRRFSRWTNIGLFDRSIVFLELLEEAVRLLVRSPLQRLPSRSATTLPALIVLDDRIHLSRARRHGCPETAAKLFSVPQKKESPTFASSSTGGFKISNRGGNPQSGSKYRVRPCREVVKNSQGTDALPATTTVDAEFFGLLDSTVTGSDWRSADDDLEVLRRSERRAPRVRGSIAGQVRTFDSAG